MPKYNKNAKRKYTDNKCSEGVLKFIQPGEVFVEVTPDMVPGVFDYYQISNYGRLYHNYRQVMLKPSLHGTGYMVVSLATKTGYKTIRLHRLVMIAHHDIPDRDLYEVNHINGDKTCNYDWNLEWATPKENVHHAYRTGLAKIGDDRPESTITDEIAFEICMLLEQNKYTNQQIADMVGTTQSIVNHIRNGESWKHLSCNFTFTKSRQWRLFTEDQVHNICKYFEIYYRGNLSYMDHARNALVYCGYNTSDKYANCAAEIYLQRYYKNISQNYNFNSIVQRLSPLGGEIPHQE